MGEAYPSSISTFTLTGRFVKGIADSEDVDKTPEVIPIVGAMVTIAPSLVPPIIRVPNAIPDPVTIYQTTIVATTDDEGYLTTELDSSHGVVLIWGYDPDIIPTGWDWHVTVSIGGNFPDRNFVVSGSDGGVFDLASMTPV